MFRKVIATQLLVRDLTAATAFYRDTLGLELRVEESTPDSVAFVIGDLHFFLLDTAGAAHMMGEDPRDLQTQGPSRSLFAVRIDDVDATYEDLVTKGAHVLGPPTDQPWGLRTAYFADPEGNYWEINQPVVARAEG